MKRTFKILGGVILLMFLITVIITRTDKARQFEDSRLIGSFQMTDSPSTVLTLHQGHMFTLENKINAKFYGDGNWETNTNDITTLTLDFENGESLNLKLIPDDSSLVSDNVQNQTIILQRLAN
jgi:hypothetical protein